MALSQQPSWVSSQRPGLETARCVSRDNVRTPPPSPAAKQKRFQRQSSLPGILWIQTNKQETIIRKTALQLGSPLLEAPQQGRFSAQSIDSVCVAFLENGQWAQRPASATRTGLPPPLRPQHTHPVSSSSSLTKSCLFSERESAQYQVWSK